MIKGPAQLHQLVRALLLRLRGKVAARHGIGGHVHLTYWPHYAPRAKIRRQDHYKAGGDHAYYQSIYEASHGSVQFIERLYKKYRTYDVAETAHHRLAY